MKIQYALVLLTSLIALSACNTQQTENTSSAATTTEAVESVVAEEEYVLPSENVLVYQTYTLEEVAEKSGKVLGLLDQDLMPVVIVAPYYPKNAFVAKIEGTVKAEFTVPNVGSRVKQIKILSSQPDDSFGKEALAAIEQWKFETAKIKTTKYTITNVTAVIHFKIENGKPTCYINDVNSSHSFYPPAPFPCNLSTE